MRRRYLITVLLGLAQALALAAIVPARAEDTAAPTAESPADPPLALAPLTAPADAVQPAAQTPAAGPMAAAPAPIAATDPVVAIVRAKLADPAIGKGANADDLAALAAFYAARAGGPLWITEMGFSAKGQEVIFEIEQADDWGLDAGAFALPPASEMPASAEAQATAEIALDLAFLKYARFARGGRLSPPQVSELYDQAPPLRDPNAVLAEIEAAEAPDAYLLSLQPKHEQFQLLRQALLKARGKGEIAEPDEKAKDQTAASQPEKGAEKGKDEKAEKAKDEKGKTAAKETDKPADKERDIKRILLNMERWRWMPEDLGSVYVWNNSPEFMLYVVKDGKPIYSDKTLVGTINYATPVFTTPMQTIVFNPDWNAPETVVTENLLPHLRSGNYSILKTHKLSVSYQGNPVNVSRINWSRANILNYTFTQKGGPGNVLGKVKFLYPNKHVVYMHDTIPSRKKFFKKPVRMIGHECVRMEKPDRFAEVLLAEANGWPASKVKALWEKGLNSAVTLEHKLPVHMVYFTAVAGESGKVATFADVYGLDRKLATALFGDATGFPPPPPEAKQPQVEASASRSTSRTAAGDGIAGSLGFLGD